MGYTIVQIYRVVRGSVGFNVEMLDFLATNGISISICLSGQMYTDQVTEIERKIERLAIENRGAIMLSQMSLCLMKLRRMRTFDVCGWFTLGHQTLVGMASFIATYLVVLLQVGGEQSFSFETIL
ncbi:uncharacterized protein [Palaemon carinicauda]|uniref:uncharacterized protein n=1 Tax=Palaemon carinicauda TaxID=392227 RepID=UPI0035B67E09